jgi:prepilin-type N-terminal cleavage/methylation domain-containing protein
MLKLFSSASGRRRIQSCSGWTLVEMMVAVAAGAIILGSFLVTTITVSNTMLAVGNYNDLDKFSRNTLDTLSRDIRNAAAVDNASTATFLNLTNTYHTYNNNNTNIIRYA